MTKEDNVKHKDGYFNCTCPICGEKFHRKPYSLKIAKTKLCCSRECLREYKRELMSGEGNHQYGLKGSKNPTWKSDEKISRYGYRMIRKLDHPFRTKQNWVLEHRLIAEQYLLTDDNSVLIDGKRYLSPDFVVHHKNFDRLDNRVENLEIMSKKEHQSYHSKLNMRERDAETGRFIEDDDAVKIRKLTETAIKPKRETDGAAGYDLCVDCSEKTIIQPHKSVMMSTGLSFSIPKGYCGLIFARSGISTKRGIRPTTCVSIIDSDYRGEVRLPLYNDSDEPQTIEPYERVAQMLIMKPMITDIEVVDSLDETERGEKGFGSTGK